MSFYEILKFFHILLAIIAIGFNASYGIWLARLPRSPEHTTHVLRGVKILDDRFANPAYALLLVTGIALVFVGDLSFRTFWISTALGLYGLLIVGGLVGYSPTLKRQIALAEAGRIDSDEYRRLTARGTVIGIALAVIVVIIVFLMVTKPTL